MRDYFKGQFNPELLFELKRVLKTRKKAKIEKMEITRGYLPFLEKVHPLKIIPECQLSDGIPIVAIYGYVENEAIILQQALEPFISAKIVSEKEAREAAAYFHGATLVFNVKTIFEKKFEVDGIEYRLVVFSRKYSRHLHVYKIKNDP